MNKHFKTWVRLQLLASTICIATDVVAAPDQPATFKPPLESSLPNNYFGKMVTLGKYIFDHTAVVAPQYVGNNLTCGNCHLDSGREAYAAPMWAAYPMYPSYQEKHKQVETIEMRVQNCFLYSMNGKKPPLDDHLMLALSTYMFWLSTGAPTDVQLPGRGFIKLAPSTKKPSPKAGAALYKTQCASCHGENGEGMKISTHRKPTRKMLPVDKYIFPPLWGNGSYNWGAGMHVLPTAAAFIQSKMPYQHGFTLTADEAWDIAAFINSQPRPQDPRFKGNIAETKAKYHNHDCLYGDTVDGHVVGKGFLPKK